MSRDHLDDEMLSAAIDGEARRDALDHLAACAECGARLAALRSVASAVSGAVVHRSAGETDRAVAAALDAAGAGVGTDDAIAVAPSSDSRPALAGDRRGGVITMLRRRPAAWAMAAAAALILAAGITGALRLGGNSENPAHVGLSQSRTGSAVGAPEAAQGAAAGALRGTPPVMTVPDLGAQNDAAAVAALVRSRLSGGAAAPAAPALGAAPSDQASEATVPAQTLACAPEAARAAGVAPTSPLRLVGGLQWRGEAAAVFAFDQPGTSSGLAGVIVRPSDCAALAALPF